MKDMKDVRVTVDVTGLDAFKELLNLVRDMLNDSRIPGDAREEHYEKLDEILQKAKEDADGK